MTVSATYDARALAIGWLSTAVASADDGDVPALHRTISVEHYEEGARFIATDRYVLLHSFVPNVDHKPADEPPLEIAPEETTVAIDGHHRAAAMLGFLLKLAKQIEKSETNEPMPEVALSLGVVEDDDEATFDGLEHQWVTLEYPGRERVRLQTYDGTYPDWRALTTSFQPVTTKAIAINPDLFGRLGKLGRLHDGAPLRWHFGGPDKPALIELADDSHPTAGLIMPVRVDL